MTSNLASIVDTYLKDTAFQDNSRRIIAKREASIPTFKRICDQFIDGSLDIQTFRDQLEKALRTEEDWGATGPSFLMEINKLAKYPRENYSVVNGGLLLALSDLKASNLGKRIEGFYGTLLQDREALANLDKQSHHLVAPGNSAFIISLFAFWLDRPGEPLIYYLSLRRGLKMLLEAGLIPKPMGLRIVSDQVEVRSDADHQAFLQALNSIVTATQQFMDKSGPYWAERFLRWITDNSTVLEEQIEIEQPEVLKTIIPHEPLRPVEDALLKRLIAEVQRDILVEEAVIRRIYHALLAGHVILTGPPGTGKTELAQRIPEILWQSKKANGNLPANSQSLAELELTTRTAYTTTLVTATDEWSTRTLISGIEPNISSGQVSYHIEYGHLTNAILKNWAVNPDEPGNWQHPQRVSLYAPSALDHNRVQEYRGNWLIIDEFNRAPIDIALGEALTALGGRGMLRVQVEGGSVELPLPQDFRIIGTLNSFDRNYLNQISEALKRRFSSVEILPPSRAQRQAEQTIVLYKALKSLRHLSEDIKVNDKGGLSWWHYSSDAPNARESYLTIAPVTETYHIWWTALNNGNQVQQAFEIAWDIFEVIRIYRLLGTAQAIAFVRQMLITGLMVGHIDTEGWIDALDTALCDTIADQLQVLLPDELEVLLMWLKLDKDAFIARYNDFLAKLVGTPRRLHAQLEALSTVVDENGRPLLSDADVEQLAEQEKPRIAGEKLVEIFNLDHPHFNLPQFTRRLRSFKAERGL